MKTSQSETVVDTSNGANQLQRRQKKTQADAEITKKRLKDPQSCMMSK